MKIWPWNKDKEQLKKIYTAPRLFEMHSSSKMREKLLRHYRVFGGNGTFYSPFMDKNPVLPYDYPYEAYEHGKEKDCNICTLLHKKTLESQHKNL